MSGPLVDCIYGAAHDPHWNGTHYVCFYCGGHCCRTIWPHSVMPTSGDACR